MEVQQQHDPLRPRMHCRKMTMDSDSFQSHVISRQDAISFVIPQSYNCPPVSTARGLPESSSPTLARSHVTSIKAKSLETLTGEIGSRSIGNICLEIWFSHEDNLLLIRLIRVDLLAKPSTAAIGTSWDVQPEVKICLLHEKRTFWDSGQSRTPYKLVPHAAAYVPVKRNVVNEQILRLTVFDGLRKNDHIPIGFVFIKLNELDLTWKSSSYVREIVSCSEPSGFTTGRIQVDLRWDRPSDQLHLRIGTADALKSPHGTLKRFFFVRLSVFLSGKEIKHFKSDSTQANPDVHLDVDYTVHLPSKQITECCILIQMYAKSREKLSFAPELIGSTIIGPYMPKAFNSFTHWENMIANPLEDVSDVHMLHL